MKVLKDLFDSPVMYFLFRWGDIASLSWKVVQASGSASCLLGFSWHWEEPESTAGEKNLWDTWNACCHHHVSQHKPQLLEPSGRLLLSRSWDVKAKDECQNKEAKWGIKCRNVTEVEQEKQLESVISSVQAAAPMVHPNTWVKQEILSRRVIYSWPLCALKLSWGISGLQRCSFPGRTFRSGSAGPPACFCSASASTVRQSSLNRST